ncbi:MAG: 23S rRNA (uracil(1939)-C(5))-methyltransferase [Gammaproteobacteria bacterium]|nr:23S rRNA (uracil(1939)-C(5))-methyltransferase [Gammaproteobacteria bacterium]
MAKLPAEVTVDVSALDEAMLGIANLDGRALRVRNALPGETVQTRVLRRKKGIVYGDGVLVEHPHESRRASICPYFPRCGGCSMHHMDYPMQLELKQRQLAQALDSNAVVPRGWSAPQKAGRLGYRRKARLGVRMVGEQVLVGFRESFSNRVARMDSCATLTPELSALLPDLKRLLPQLSIADQVPQIEVAQGDTQCVLIVRHLQPMTESDVELWREFAQTHAVEIIFQAKGYDTLVPLSGGPLKRLGYRLADHGLYIEFLPHQFTQVNLAMNETLIRYVLAYLGNLQGKNVLDLFCGIGNFTLPIARAGARAWGMESAPEAVAMACVNALNNGVADQLQFSVADLFSSESAVDVAAILAQCDALVLDPPRSGAGPGLHDWLTHFAGNTIVYVSCNPNSFASDAAIIVAAGFELAQVGIFDMFPSTAHVETMGQFVRRSRETTVG